MNLHNQLMKEQDTCPCDWCGAWIGRGDEVWYDLAGGDAFCSEVCATNADSERGREAEPADDF